MNQSLLICPICLDGRLENLIEKIQIDLGSITLDNIEIESHFSICDTCGCEQANATQISQNKNIMLELKHRILQEQANNILYGKHTV